MEKTNIRKTETKSVRMKPMMVLILSGGMLTSLIGILVDFLNGSGLFYFQCLFFGWFGGHLLFDRREAITYEY